MATKGNPFAPGGALSLSWDPEKVNTFTGEPYQPIGHQTGDAAEAPQALREPEEQHCNGCSICFP